MEDTVGMRVELIQDIETQQKGDRGVIGTMGGYIGVVFDGREGLVICHAKQPITNFVKIIDDERIPEPVQMSLFGD